MSFLTPELKQQVVHEVGVRVEDAMEAAKGEVHLIEGRQTAFLEAAQLSEMLSASLNKDVDAGTLTMDEAKKLMPYLTKLAQQFRQLTVQMANQRNLAAGKVQGLEQTVKLLNNMVEIEKAKQARMVQPPPESAGGNPAHRFVGMKERRMAEEAGTQPEAPSVQADPPAVESPAESADASAEIVAEAPKRRGRKPRGTDA